MKFIGFVQYVKIISLVSPQTLWDFFLYWCIFKMAKPLCILESWPHLLWRTWTARHTLGFDLRLSDPWGLPRYSCSCSPSSLRELARAVALGIGLKRWKDFRSQWRGSSECIKVREVVRHMSNFGESTLWQVTLFSDVGIIDTRATGKGISFQWHYQSL